MDDMHRHWLNFFKAYFQIKYDISTGFEKVLTCDMKIQHFISHTHTTLFFLWFDAQKVTNNNRNKIKKKSPITKSIDSNWLKPVWKRSMDRLFFFLFVWMRNEWHFSNSFIMNNHELLRQYFSIGFQKCFSSFKCVQKQSSPFSQYR